MNARMVDAFRLEAMDIRFSLSPSFPKQKASTTESIDEVMQIGRSKYKVQTDEMLDLTVTVRNRSSKPIHPLLRLQPSLRHQPSNVALDLSRRLAWTGMLQQVLPILPSGVSTSVTIGVTIFCHGEYEVGASIEEVRTLRSTPGFEKDQKSADDAPALHDDEAIRDSFGLDVTRRRRIWHARETCIMHACD
jgi:hypothetical protein